MSASVEEGGLKHCVGSGFNSLGLNVSSACELEHIVCVMCVCLCLTCCRNCLRAKHHTLTPDLTPIKMSPVTFISLVKDAAAGANR